MAFITIENVSKTFVTGRRLRHLFSPNASKRLARITALDDVSLAIGQGECFGLVGPNGAGKTTLLKILATLILPDGGTVKVNGYDLKRDRQIKGSIGLVTGDERSFYWRITARQNLEFFASLHQLPAATSQSRINELCHYLEVDNLDRPFQEYSTGLKQRVALARALLHDPPILLLDEPTRSLDRKSAEQFRLFIQQLVKRERKTVVYATHNTQEVSLLFDRVGLLRQGQLVQTGPWAQVSKEYLC